MTELVRTYKLTDSGAWGWVTEEAEGGGGGSLPSWWTVDSTPGSESVEFAGAAIINVSTPAEDGDNILTLGAVDGLGPPIRFDTYGSIYGQSLSLTGTDDVFAALTLLHLTSTASQTALVGLENPSGEVFGIANTGAVTISPSDAVPGDYTDVFKVKDANGDNLFRMLSAGGGDFYIRDTSQDGLTITDAVGTSGRLFAATPFGAAIAFEVGPSGAVTISPSDGSQNNQFLFDSPTTIAEAATLFSFRSAEAGEYLGADGDGTLRLGNGLILANTVSDEMAFFHGTLTSKPTGVAVNAAGIHAALVTLNLIEA